MSQSAYWSRIRNAVYRHAGVILSPLIRSRMVTGLVASKTALQDRPLIIRGSTFGRVSTDSPGVTVCVGYFDPHFNGVYGLDSNLFECSALVRGQHRTHFNSPLRVDVQKDCNTIPTCIYGGILFGRHFGHFLTETMSRLWWLMDSALSADSDVPILFRLAGRNRHDRCEMAAFATSVLRKLGISERVLIPTEPVTVEECIIPHAAIVNNHSVHVEYITLMRELGGRLLNGNVCSTGRGSRKLYLSRSRLPARTRKLANEKQLEVILRRAGYDIVHPQELRIEEQVRLFHEAKEVVGPIGSAFHNLPMAVNPELTVKYLVHYEPQFATTYNNIDSALGHDAVSIHCVYLHPLNMKFTSFCDEILDVDRAVTGILQGGSSAFTEPV